MQLSFGHFLPQTYWIESDAKNKQVGQVGTPTTVDGSLHAFITGPDGAGRMSNKPNQVYI
ncbi:hypothetical protein NNRS527_00068 [Nitrosospira sp. NRS527]|nr:hypothetical protein NNRS527_00068 [Nitrosospira sp. NRS527]